MLIDGDSETASAMFVSVNSVIIRDYIESLWGSAKKYPDQVHYFRYREVATIAHPVERVRDRMPSKSVVAEIMERDGYRCRYCALPVIPPEVRSFLHNRLPEAVPWGARNADQHAAFQALWMQIEHITPHSLGGDNSLNNLAISCGGCNYGKGNWHLDELGLINPLEHPPIRSSWNGLVHVLEH